MEGLRSFVKEMSGRYARARVVDPIECRSIELGEDGKISLNERCYGIWNAEQKCINCSSALACRTGCHQEKAEHFRDNTYFIQSNPVKLRLPNGGVHDAVVELVNVEDQRQEAVNNREAENVGARAAHYLAHHDSLTNVLNADSFYELARGMIQDSAEQTWVMVTGNIMNFRLVNTLFGVQKGNEVLARTASLLREISEGARGLILSVNASAKDFYSIDVAGVMTGLVEKYGVDSRMLRIEITETALLDEQDKCDAVVSSLRQKGFLVEIDDFGKDNSSLSLLKDIQADVLKIDMSFLREIRDRERSRIILRKR